MKRFIAVLASAAVLLLGTASVANASPSPSQLAPSFLGIACAQEGPAKAYPSATKTTKRSCWWGYEYLYSKNDTKIIAGIIGGAVAGGAQVFIPTKLAWVLIIGASAAGGGMAAAVNNAIDGGKCLKLVFIAHVAPAPGTYHCT